MVAMIFFKNISKVKTLYKVANTFDEEITFYWEAVDLYGADKVEVVQYKN